VTERVKPAGAAADTVRPGRGTGKPPGRRTLPPAAAFWILAGLFLLVFAASAAASPLYDASDPAHLIWRVLLAVFAVGILVAVMRKSGV
jgi:hypothetical protein